MAPSLVSLVIENSFGNSNRQDLELEKDIVAPVLSSVVGENSGRVKDSNQNAYTVSGSCDDATATVSFSSDSQDLGSVVCDGTNFQKDIDLQSLSDGDVTLTLKIQDSSGNSDTQDLSLTKDTVSPTLSSLSGDNSNKVSFSNQASYGVSGSCDDATATISFSSGSNSLGSVVCDGTDFQKDLDLQSLSDGDITLTLSIEDSFGNESSEDLLLSKDTISPTLSSLSGINGNKVNSSNQGSYRFSGGCDNNNHTISFTGNLQSIGATLCLNMGFRAHLNLESFPEGPILINVSAVDAHGNFAIQGLSVYKDITSPTVSSVIGDNNNKVGLSNQEAYRVSGSCDDDSATISFSSGSESLGSVACDGASFEKALDLQSFDDGDIVVNLSIKDGFKNKSSQDLSLSKNTVSPTLFFFKR